MKEFIAELFTNLGQKFAMLILIGTTAVTTGTAVSKVVIKPSDAEQKIEQSDTENSNQSESDSEEARKITFFEDDSVIVTPTPTKTISAKPTPTAFPKATVTPTTKPVVNNSSKCIVTISGGQYDVTNLRSSHSGGDIFNCGTDMTATYQKKHGTGLGLISRYAYDPNNPTAVSPASGSNGSDDGDDQEEEEEHEDKRNEDRYEEKDEDDD